MPLKYTFTLSPVFQSNYFSFMVCSVDKAFNTRIPLVAVCVFVETSTFFHEVVLVVANVSRKFTQMRAACVARYFSCLDFNIYIYIVSLQLSPLLKLPTLLVNLSTLDVCKVTETNPEN